MVANLRVITILLFLLFIAATAAAHDEACTLDIDCSGPNYCKPAIDRFFETERYCCNVNEIAVHDASDPKWLVRDWLYQHCRYKLEENERYCESDRDCVGGLSCKKAPGASSWRDNYLCCQANQEATANGCVVVTTSPVSFSLSSAGGSVTPTASISGYSGRQVLFKESSGATVSSCTASSTGCSGPSFTAPSTAGTYSYSVCIDKNGDGDCADTGESATQSLAVTTSSLGKTGATCTDSDSSDKLQRGTCTDSSGTYSDYCTGNGICEYVCFGNACVCTTSTSCPTGTSCQNGACGSTTTSCSGTSELTLVPASATTGESVRLTLTGLYGCAGKTATFVSGSCSGTAVDSCSISGNGCSVYTTAPAATGSYQYCVKVDKNSDGDFSDSGETRIGTLTVAGCTRKLPSVTSDRSTFAIKAGDVTKPTITVKNNDQSNCGSTIFEMVAEAPAGWSVTIGRPSFNLGPGESSQGQIEIRSSLASQATDYLVYLKVTGNNNTAILPLFYSLGTNTTPCIGIAGLSFNQTTATIGDTVLATVGGFSNCDGKGVKIVKGSCESSTAIARCTLANGTCSTTFKLPTYETQEPYFACVDKNNNQNYRDYGESASLAISVKCNCGTAAYCTLGRCSCDNGFGNCDGDWSNGCEVETRADENNCGACGTACTAGQLCLNSICVTQNNEACRSVYCGQNSGCVGGTCVCQQGWGECNGYAGDGCERNLLTDPLNCGYCGVRCGLGQTCVGGVCKSQGTNDTTVPCAGITCGAHQSCVGSCVCNSGWGNCNGLTSDGCEIDLGASRLNCGACGTACPSGQSCVLGRCTGSSSCTGVYCGRNSNCVNGSCVCDAGYGNCDGLVGCETNVYTSSSNCGSCGTTCTGSCVNGTCGSGCDTCTGVSCESNQHCTAGSCYCDNSYSDCDGDSPNGCEVNIKEDEYNCGSCGNECGNGASCGDGFCKCDSGHYNCDDDWSNGCESDQSCGTTNCFNSDTSCGASSCTDCNSLDGYYDFQDRREQRNYYCSDRQCLYRITSTTIRTDICRGIRVMINTKEEAGLFGYGLRVFGNATLTDGSPATVSSVALTADFGTWSSFTNSQGYFSFLVTPSSGTHTLTVKVTKDDASGETSRTITIQDIVVDATVSPTIATVGGEVTVSGTVKYRGTGVAADVEMASPSGTFRLIASPSGTFSKSFIYNLTGSSTVKVKATHKGSEGFQNLLIRTSTSGEDFGWDAPSRVRPSAAFLVNGSWSINGVPAENRQLEIRFTNTTRTITVRGGVFSLSFVAPATEGCYRLVARGKEKEVCVKRHEYLGVDIDLVPRQIGANTLKVLSTYEDDSPVTGNLTYIVDGTERRDAVQDGKKDVSLNLEKGRHLILAFVSDGLFSKSASRTFDIGIEPEPPKPEVVEKIEVSVPRKVEIYKGAGKQASVVVKNSGNVRSTIRLKVNGTEIQSITLEPNKTAEIPITLTAMESATFGVEAVGSATADYGVIAVEVKDYSLTFQNTVVKEGYASLTYKIEGDEQGPVTVRELLKRGDFAVYDKELNATLPLTNDVRANLTAGTYTLCIEADGGNLLKGCKDIVVKGEISEQTRNFFVAVVLIVILLLLF